MSKKTKSKKVAKNKVADGQMVSLHYIGTLDDGTEFDNSRKREEVMSVEVGSGDLIPGFDKALSGMTVGEVKNFKLSPGEAYGEVISEAYQTVPQTSFPSGFELEVGKPVLGRGPSGQPIPAKIDSVGDDSVVLNFNHPLAGKTLNFEVELLSIDKKED